MASKSTGGRRKMSGGAAKASGRKTAAKRASAGGLEAQRELVSGCRVLTA